MENATIAVRNLAWEYFTLTADIFIVYVTFISLIFGFIGNLLSMVIFYVKRKVDRVSAGWLGPLAFFDLWNVGQGFFYWLVLGAGKMTNGAIGLTVYAADDVGCWFAWFCAQCFMAMSGWILVAFSLERCLALWFPLKMMAVLTPRKRRNAIIGLVCCIPIFCITFITEKGHYYGDESWVEGCPPKAEMPTILKILFWFIAVGLGAAIPCISILIINIFILIGVKRSGSLEGKHAKNASQNESRCLKNLVLVSSFYLIFMSPYSVFWVWVGVSTYKVPYVTELSFYSLNWASQNYCINPLLYCYSLPWYRRTALTVLTCGLVREKNGKSAEK